MEPRLRAPRPDSLGELAGEFLRRRNLLVLLALREIRTRYAQSILGVGWALFSPLSMMLVTTILFGKVIRVDTGGVAYPLFVFTALVPWSFFAASMGQGASSLLSHAALVTKTYFPREILPISALLSVLLDTAVQAGFLAGLFVWYGFLPPATALWAVPLFALQIVFVTGLALGGSAMNLFYRDVRHALPIAIQLLFFVTPVAFPSNLLAGDWAWVVRVNPLALWMESYRGAVLYGLAPAPQDWLTLSGWAFASFAAGAWIFRRAEPRFGEIL